MGKAFISYSHQNIEIVEEVNRLLNESNILTWIDRNSIRTGDQWEINIATSINTCNVFLLFYSKDYKKSPYCQKEYEIYKKRQNSIPLIAIALDDTYLSFDSTDTSSYQFLNYNYKANSAEAIVAALLECPAIRNCRILAENSKEIGESTEFLNALCNVKAKHYQAIDVLCRFLFWLEKQESNGKFISEKADFSSLFATPLSNESFALSLVGETDLCSTFNREVRDNYIRNVFYALFKFGNIEFKRTAPTSLDFASRYEHYDHHFLRGTVGTEFTTKVYSSLNSQLSEIYTALSDEEVTIPKLIQKLFDLYNASRFYETQDPSVQRQLDYEVNPSILSISRNLFIEENGLNISINGALCPTLMDENNQLVVLSPQGTFEGNSHGDDNLLIHGEYGSGKTYLLQNIFLNNDHSLYIDLTQNYDSIREIIERQRPGLFRINFNDLTSYSVCKRRVTLLIDNIDDVSEERRKFFLSELVFYSKTFRVILVSSKYNLEEKVSLNRDGDSFSYFSRYHIKTLSSEQVINYLDWYLAEKNINASSIIRDLRSLDKNNTFFEIFNDFTRLNILVSSIADWSDFTIANLNAQFDSPIGVYQKIFESDCDYSIARKIASYFQNSIVPIEDVIIDLVLEEITELKVAAYNSYVHGLPSLANIRLRFGEFYPMLTAEGHGYSFLNEDIRSYFAASYIFSSIKEEIETAQIINYDKRESLLLPVRDKYLILKYLADMGIMETFRLEDVLEAESHRTELIYTLYKILQYEKDESTRTVFLQCAQFSDIPDKFFMGVENIKKVSIPANVTHIGRAAFANMSSLREIDFAPRSSAYISNKKELIIKPWAILNCPVLEKIRLGKNYKTYNGPLFSRCFALSCIDLDPDNTEFATLMDGQLLVSADKKTLYCSTNSLRGEVIIPDTIEELKPNSLAYLQYVTSIFIPKATKNIDTSFSDFCDILSFFFVDKENESFWSTDDGLIFTKTDKGNTLFRVPSGLKGDLIIPSDVSVIGSDSISCCSYIENITVPASVRHVEDYAFADTYSLQSIKFERLSSIERFGNYIFLSTRKEAKIFSGDMEYSLKTFQAAYYRPLADSTFRGRIITPLSSTIFTKRGFEWLNLAEFPERTHAAIARDITLFNETKYHPQDFNILLIGLTEYNLILTKTPLQAETYIHELITNNNISMVVFTRDLPNLTIFETNEAYRSLLIARTDKSSSSATSVLSAIIKELGGNK